MCKLTDHHITGAVGKQLLKDLLQNGQYAKVVSVGRREVKLEDSVPQDKLVCIS
jgi:oxidoreductase